MFFDYFLLRRENILVYKGPGVGVSFTLTVKRMFWTKKVQFVPVSPQTSSQDLKLCQLKTRRATKLKNTFELIGKEDLGCKNAKHVYPETQKIKKS